MIYLGACLIAGIRLARATHINHRQIPTSNAIDESVDLAHEIYNRVFRKVPERLECAPGSIQPVISPDNPKREQNRLHIEAVPRCDDLIFGAKTQDMANFSRGT